ncbi:hypothetical protein BDZ90DRAFT_262500 [Jaminaea rosea]|uniref:Uncharacterized protein n=1 Tax=Jaminaea rosea TaxID=1569628 RepID=A0A316UM99_9BASI|nr:hypothetical protein BDZ90DRAFT_262500 [Jaminaea rosea]PWN25043.1 hypothetical protein BDZ90DRAFT_262500 [Jaminaea rosea]
MLVGAFFAVLALLVSLTEAYEDSPKPATSSSPALAMPASSSNVAGGQSDAPSAYPDMAVCKVQTVPYWVDCFEDNSSGNKEHLPLPPPDMVGGPIFEAHRSIVICSTH